MSEAQIESSSNILRGMVTRGTLKPLFSITRPELHIDIFIKSSRNQDRSATLTRYVKNEQEYFVITTIDDDYENETIDATDLNSALFTFQSICNG